MIHVHDLQNVKIGKLRCSVADTDHVPLFFSLVDYRNNLFTSNDPEKIIEFYDGFDNRDQLIQWMKERPKGESYIHEVEGDKDIIVVIPTADFNGKYAKECRDNIFKGLHMIFVESGGKDDIYFNYAHNCNVGIKRAMEYNPKWIVLSNDDMYRIHSIERLKAELMVVNNDAISAVFTQKKQYHSVPARIAKQRFVRKLLFLILDQKVLGKHRLALEKRYSVTLFPATSFDMFGKYFFKSGWNYISIGDFMILSAKYVNSLGQSIFDETYVNGYEDDDLSVRLIFEGTKFKRINYEIGDLIGSTMGKNKSKTRALRDIANASYFNFKLEIRETKT